MFRLSSIFHDTSETYINIPSIKKFCKRNSINLHGETDKRKLIDAIEEYADSDTQTREDVLNWIDNTAKEGIKEIQIKYRELPVKMQIIFSNEQLAIKYLDSYLTPGLLRHISGNKYDYNHYEFVKYYFINNKYGKSITLYFCKKVLFVETESACRTTKEVDFPIIVEYYLDKSWLFIRYKSRAGLYYFDPEGFTVDSKRVSMTTEISSIEEVVDRILDFEKWDENSNSIIIKRKLYQILARYTHTPAEIQK